MIETIGEYLNKGCGRCARFDSPTCSALIWGETIRALRDLCLAQGLEETVKWGQPCYTYAGRNIALIGALRNDVRLSFFSASLMKDPHGVLEKQGPNSQSANVMRFTGVADVGARAEILAGYLREAMDYAAEGKRPARRTVEFQLPEELVDALDADAEMADAFHALTRGRQRSYVINLEGAKKRETRVARIAKFRPKIIAGKGANEY